MAIDCDLAWSVYILPTFREELPAVARPAGLLSHPREERAGLHYIRAGCRPRNTSSAASHCCPVPTRGGSGQPAGGRGSLPCHLCVGFQVRIPWDVPHHELGPFAVPKTYLPRKTGLLQSPNPICFSIQRPADGTPLPPQNCELWLMSILVCKSNLLPQKQL